MKQEVSSQYRPRLLAISRSPRSYPVIMVGSPNWCQTIAPPLASWLYKNDLSGKILLPFCSHCGGDAGDFRGDIARLCPKSDVREVLSVVNDGGEELTALIHSWLDRTGITASLPFRAG